MLDEGSKVLGLDNINDYYDVNLKYGRLNELGINNNKIVFNKIPLHQNTKIINLSKKIKKNK